MAFEGPVEDRLAIRERLDAYAGAVMRHEFDAWIACWADDATWLWRGQSIAGRDAIGAAWLSAMGRYRFVAFHVTQDHVVVSGDDAVSRAHTLEFLVPHDGPERRQHGLYRDRLVRRSGAWLFAERAFEVLHLFTEPETRSPS